MPGEFFQIPQDMQLPDVAGQIEEIEESESLAWAPGGEPDPGSDGEQTTSKIDPGEYEEDRRSEESSLYTREYLLHTGPAENDFNSESSEDSRGTYPENQSCIEAWKYRAGDLVLSSGSRTPPEQECPEPTIAPGSAGRSEDRSPVSEMQSDPSERDARSKGETETQKSHEERILREREEER